MLRNKSSIYHVLLSLLFVLSVVLGLGYMVSRAVLQDVRHTLMVEKAKWVADAIQKSLEETINNVSLFKESWVDSLTWLPVPPSEGVRGEAAGGADAVQFREKWEKMRQLFPLWQVDFLLILDSSGRVLHQLPDAFSGERPFSDELLDAARQELQSHELWMTLDRMEGHLAVQVFSYLPNEQSKGSMVVFGQYLEKLVLQLETDHPDLTFLLAGDDDLLGSDPIARDSELLNPDLIEQAIEENRPQFDDNTRLLWNLYYAPLQLLDQTVCLIVPIELKAAQKILNRSQKKLRQAGWFSLLGVVLAGTALTFWLLLPLRRAQAQAQAVLTLYGRVAETTEGEAAANQSPTGNEIKAVQQALTVVSRQLEAQQRKEEEPL
ncbi:MAG: hypothetical protein HQL80_07320 [Magnetococcales bacterium]|nr:hypothetical protein [Magnetococcales bacterium]